MNSPELVGAEAQLRTLKKCDQCFMNSPELVGAEAQLRTLKNAINVLSIDLN